MGWWRRGSSDNKLHPGPYVDAHLAALVDGRTGRDRVSDVVWLYGPSCVIAFVAIADRWTIDAAQAALIGVPTGLLAAYLVQFIFQMFDRASAWADTNPDPSPATSEHGRLLQELNAHGAYSAAISIAAAGFALLAGIHKRDDLVEHLLAAATYGLLVHLALMLLLIVRRAFLYSDRRLREARTGAHQVRRKRAS